MYVVNSESTGIFEVFQKFSLILYPIIHSILPANIYTTYVYLPKCINLIFPSF